jgi:hypothetical protein
MHSVVIVDGASEKDGASFARVRQRSSACVRLRSPAFARLRPLLNCSTRSRNRSMCFFEAAFSIQQHAFSSNSNVGSEKDMASFPL